MIKGSSSLCPSQVKTMSFAVICVSGLSFLCQTHTSHQSVPNARVRVGGKNEVCTITFDQKISNVIFSELTRFVCRLVRSVSILRRQPRRPEQGQVTKQRNCQFCNPTFHCENSKINSMIMTKSELLGVLLRKKRGEGEGYLFSKENASRFQLVEEFPKNIKDTLSVTHAAL